MYFLAIVGDPDIKVGNWVPSYVLCRINSNSPNRTGWKVVDANGKYKDTPKLLVRTIEDKEVMIDFMSKFRTRKHRHGSRRFAHKNTKKFYPRGILCWFECDMHGRQTGPALVIKRVPDLAIKRKVDRSKEILAKEYERQVTVKDLFTEDKNYMNIEESHGKIEIPQTGIRSKHWKPVRPRKGK